MYIDASAILVLLFEEPDAAALAARIDASRTKLITSPVSLTEAILRYASHKSAAIEDAQEIILDMMKTLQVQNISITPEIGNRAVQAYARFGKGTDIQHSSISATSFPTLAPRTMAFRCSTRATISREPTLPDPSSIVRPVESLAPQAAPPRDERKKPGSTSRAFFANNRPA